MFKRKKSFSRLNPYSIGFAMMEKCIFAVLRIKKIIQNVHCKPRNAVAANSWFGMLVGFCWSKNNTPFQRYDKFQIVQDKNRFEILKCSLIQNNEGRDQISQEHCIKPQPEYFRRNCKSNLRCLSVFPRRARLEMLEWFETQRKNNNPFVELIFLYSLIFEWMKNLGTPFSGL